MALKHSHMRKSDEGPMVILFAFFAETSLNWKEKPYYSYLIGFPIKEFFLAISWAGILPSHWLIYLILFVRSDLPTNETSGMAVSSTDEGVVHYDGVYLRLACQGREMYLRRAPLVIYDPPSTTAHGTKASYGC